MQLGSLKRNPLIILIQQEGKILMQMYLKICRLSVSNRSLDPF